MANKISYIILHNSGGILNDRHFDTSKQTFEQIERYHKQKAQMKRWKVESSLNCWCAYNYVIDYKGKLTQARLDTERGWHTYGKNEGTIGICMIGNFSRFEPPKEPSEAQKETLLELLLELTEKYDLPVSYIVPHRFWGNTDCFGRNLSDDFGQKLVKKHIKKELLKKKLTLLEKLMRLFTMLLRAIKGKKLGQLES